MNDPAGSESSGGFVHLTGDPALECSVDGVCEIPEQLVRLRIDLAYDGTEFVGWAKQPGLRSVQGELERGFRFAMRLPVEPRVTCAGRTDSGVHARGQVAHVDIPREAWAALDSRATYRLRAVLPADIALAEVDLAPDDFDARFSALSRRYVYRVWDGTEPMDPIRRREVYSYGKPLDLEAMNQAAEKLLGLHDFAAFCRSREGATTIRTLERLEWQRGETGLAELTVAADAFCHSMVRSLVGSLLPVGVGVQSADWPASFLLPAEGGSVDLSLESITQNRGPFTVAPAHGLTLEEVTYPADNQLAERNQRTRARRDCG